MDKLYNEIINVDKIASKDNVEDISAVINLAKKNKIKKEKDAKKRLLIAIDIQNDFMESIGTLAVNGSKNDVKQLTQWIYNNLSKVSQIMCSLDNHSLMQIFHPDWWMNSNGENPAPFTIIMYNDVIENKWMTSNPANRQISLDYLKNLELQGKKQLCIWPHHCLEGTYGAELETEFKKIVYYHSVVTSTTPIFIRKGQNPNTEMYGIIKAEYDPENHVNKEILDIIAQFDEVYIAGEASSHCVLDSVLQIIEFFKDDKEKLSNIILLEDCMSPIACFEEVTIKAFKELSEKYNIQIRKSTDIVL